MRPIGKDNDVQSKCDFGMWVALLGGACCDDGCAWIVSTATFRRKRRFWLASMVVQVTNRLRLPSGGFIVYQNVARRGVLLVRPGGSAFLFVVRKVVTTCLLGLLRPLLRSK